MRPQDNEIKKFINKNGDKVFSDLSVENYDEIQTLKLTKADKTEIPDTSNFATKGELEDTNLRIDVQESTLSTVITDVDTMSVQVTQLQGDVNNLDLDKADKNSVYTKGETNSLLNNKQDKGDYATNTTVTDYYNELTQDIDDLSTIVDSKANQSDTYTKDEVDEKFTHVTVDAYTKEETDTLLSAKANQTSLNQTNNNVDALTGEVENIAGELDSKADKSEIPTIPTNISYFNNDSGYVDDTYHDNTKQDKLTAGENITIENNVISASDGLSEVSWGEITGTLSNQTDLKTALDNKQNTITDLSTIRVNAQIGAGLSTQVGDNTSNIAYLDEKVREIELFKFPNAVIIGEPNISNGQVSGFSTSNYLQFPFILDLHNQAFQIDFCFTTATNVTTQQNILDSNFGLALAIQNGKGVMAISSNGTSWDIGSSIGSITIQSNTTYYARLLWNRLQYKTQLSTDGVNYVDDMVIVDTRSPFPRTMFIGGCDQVETGHTPHPFLGTINMNKAYLSVMGNVIWQGMDDAGLATRADISLSNLDEIGQAKFDEKQDVIDDLDNIRTNATAGKSASDTISNYGNIVTYNASDFLPSSTTLLTITDVDNRINASTKFLKKNAADTTSGVVTFKGGKGGSGAQPSLIATNGFYVGGYDVTTWADVTSHRLVSDKVNTGSYYIDGNGSVLFRHKTGTKTAEGSANDVMFTMNPVTGFRAGFSGTAGTGITDADLHDVLIDTVQYLTLQTTAKDIIGAINELKSRLDSLG